MIRNATKAHGCQIAIARFLDRMCLALWASGLWFRYATLQNVIPSFPWIAPPRPPPWRNPRKGRDQILPSGNLDVNDGIVGGFSEFQMGLVTAACAVAAAVFAFCIRPRSELEMSQEGRDENSRSRVRQNMLAFFGVRST